MHCLICERPMRPSHSTLDEHPGTVAHAGRGMCWKHYLDAKRNNFAGFPENDRAVPVRLGRNPAVGDPHEYVVAGLESYLARRRKRLVSLDRRIPRRGRVAA